MDKLLIANRGEIVVRIARTARDLGIRTVAVYSDADADAPHVRACDEAVHIGASPASQSYLNIDAIIDAARATGADAIHPGYGFLSERAEFARAVEAAGITFVGPTAEVMDQMGRKDRAREIAIAAGVPVVPSDATSYPVLVKAAAGGGGKGMRVVRDPAELDAAIEAARREAATAFGDDTILIEAYVEKGRHLEVQVFGDQQGNVVHLFERDCSTQRRHQKVIEEAPAPGITDAVRQRLTSAAVALATQVGYVGAGTVEFLVDPSKGAEGVYFLEMNTRLQVEHPVTEEVVRVRGERIDLVELQLSVADGAEIPFKQGDVSLEGHAIEARIYAEDAFNGFLPQAGRSAHVAWPAEVRVDHALESHQRVTTFYDPMLGKVIASAPDREAARHALVDALDETLIFGLKTNTGFVRAVADSDAFAHWRIHTSWLDDHVGEIEPPALDEALSIAATAAGTSSRTFRLPSPFWVGDGWRLGGPSAKPVATLMVDGELRRVSAGSDPEWALGASRTRTEVIVRGELFSFVSGLGLSTYGHRTATAGTLTAPMPGTMLTVEVNEGDQVTSGQRLGVVEAMKMELVLKAPHDGVVTSVNASVGQQVTMGAPLFEIGPTP